MRSGGAAGGVADAMVDRTNRRRRGAHEVRREQLVDPAGGGVGKLRRIRDERRPIRSEQVPVIGRIEQAAPLRCAARGHRDGHFDGNATGRQTTRPVHVAAVVGERQRQARLDGAADVVDGCRAGNDGDRSFGRCAQPGAKLLVRSGPQRDGPHGQSAVAREGCASSTSTALLSRSSSRSSGQRLPWQAGRSCTPGNRRRSLPRARPEP